MAGLRVGDMDASISRIADYASTLEYESLPAEVVHECKRRLVDTVGCALGAFDDEPSRIARLLACFARRGTGRGAGIWYRTACLAGAGDVCKRRDGALPRRQ